MRRGTAMSVALMLAAAGCTDTTCPASVRYTTAGIDLAVAPGTLPPTAPTSMIFSGREGEVLSFANESLEFSVATAYADWAPLTPGQEVMVRCDYGRPVYGRVSGTGVSLYVTDPATDELLFAILARNGFFIGGSFDDLTFADIAIDFEIDCTARASDCQPPSPSFPLVGIEPVDGEHLVARTAMGTTNVERGETREVDGFRIFLRDAWRGQPLLYTVECDNPAGPQREAVIARIK